MGVWFQNFNFGRDTNTHSVASNLLYPCLCPKRQICLDSINGLPCSLVFNLFQSTENADPREEDSSQETVLLHPPCGVAIKRPLPGGAEVTASACNVGDLGLIPRLGRSPGEGNDNPLQHSCLENPMDGGAW